MQQIIGATYVVAAILFYVFWLPFSIMRKRFTHELDRFSLRIQGLASKTELAELALAETIIADEITLRLYLSLAVGIATRHGILQLASRFDLWEKS